MTTLFDPAQQSIVTAPRATTNCLAPVVKVIHEKLGIRHGSMDHDLTTLTNTQNDSSICAPIRDLRRARACWQMSLIPPRPGLGDGKSQPSSPSLKGRLTVTQCVSRCWQMRPLTDLC